MRLGDGCCRSLDGDVADNIHIRAYIGENGLLGGFHYRLDKGIGRLGENERKRHLVAVDAHVVLHHFHFYDILAGAGIAHIAQGIEYELGIECHCCVLFSMPVSIVPREYER